MELALYLGAILHCFAHLPSQVIRYYSILEDRTFFKTMARFTFALCAIAALYNGVYAVTVFEGLQAANASLFAQWIQQNPGSAALYNSSQVQTVFAPNDDAFRAYNQSGSLSQLRRLLARAVVPSVQASIQTAQQRLNLEDIQGSGGTTINTNAQSASASRQQVVIANPVTTGTSTSQRKRQASNSTTSAVSLLSGLGNNVSIVQADTAYDGGVIHTLDGFVSFFFLWVLVMESTDLLLYIDSSPSLNPSTSHLRKPTQHLFCRDCLKRALHLALTTQMELLYSRPPTKSTRPGLTKIRLHQTSPVSCQITSFQIS